MLYTGPKFQPAFYPHIACGDSGGSGFGRGILPGSRQDIHHSAGMPAFRHDQFPVSQGILPLPRAGRERLSCRQKAPAGYFVSCSSAVRASRVWRENAEPSASDFNKAPIPHRRARATGGLHALAATLRAGSVPPCALQAKPAFGGVLPARLPVAARRPGLPPPRIRAFVIRA